MPNSLKKVINKEGISQTELSRTSNVSVTTIGNIYNNVEGVKTKDVTKGKLVKAINKIMGKETYQITDIFHD